MTILLVTSRETKRWVIPKGNPIAGLAPHMAAAREAFEEAGVIGHPTPQRLGCYHYPKRRKDGSVRIATVDVYALEVATQLESWPERHERTTRWFLQTEAVDVIEELELQALIRAFVAVSQPRQRQA